MRNKKSLRCAPDRHWTVIDDDYGWSRWSELEKAAKKTPGEAQKVAGDDSALESFDYTIKASRLAFQNFSSFSLRFNIVDCWATKLTRQSIPGNFPTGPSLNIHSDTKWRCDGRRGGRKNASKLNYIGKFCRAANAIRDKGRILGAWRKCLSNMTFYCRIFERLWI